MEQPETMTSAEQRRVKGRMRNVRETSALEMLCERKSVDLYEVAKALNLPTDRAYQILWRLEMQSLAKCIRAGRRGRKPMPSVWQLRETYERNN